MSILNLVQNQPGEIENEKERVVFLLWDYLATNPSNTFDEMVLIASFLRGPLKLEN